MTVMETTHIPLEQAWLCENCGSIGDNPQQCPACADATALVSLAGILNRSEE
jgi:rubrerythrin